MSPPQFHANNRNASNIPAGFSPPPLKINRNSHSIKKSSSLSSSSSSSPPLASGFARSTAAKPPHQQQQRHPVIIYTHSPKVIHTHPRDFMALVQKLTGLSRPEDDDGNTNIAAKPESGNNSSSSSSLPAAAAAEDHKNNNNIGSKVAVAANNDDNESSSVITEEYGSSSCNLGDGQVNSCSAHHQPNNPCNMTTNNHVPVFGSNSADFYGSNINQAFYSYNNDPYNNLFSGMRTSVPSSSSAVMLEELNEFREY
ncbi:VQ motif containing protein [Trema orientale]|uniref:VQ motif containing protein n=1 Tax=Trema orientale TaxID=63057 RepID=A0A2P5F9Q0_TREOI|nr:VQ motif containing protein [Trema orientale]